MGILRKCIAQRNVVGILTFDEHIGAANGPGFVVPVLAVEMGLGFAVEVTNVFFGHRQHAACAAGGVVDGFDHMAAAQVLFWRQQQINHQFDDFTGGEVLPCFFVGLLCADADQLFEHITHLHGRLVGRQAGKAQVEGGKFLDDLKQQVLLGHLADLFAKLEVIKNSANVRRVAVDVAVEVGCEVAGVVQQRIAPFC